MKREPIGHRGELAVLLPVALLVLLLTSSFVLFSFRGTIALLIEEGQALAAEDAVTLAARLAGENPPRLGELQRQYPDLVALRVLDASGQVVDEVRGEGRSSRTLKARAPFKHRGASFELEVERDEAFLVGRRQVLSWLTPTIIVIDLGVILLILIALQRFFKPLDRAFSEAERWRGRKLASDDLAGLVETFEQALAALSKPKNDDELRALERTLGKAVESGVLLLDERARVLALNPVGAHLLGLEAPVREEEVATWLSPHPRLCAVVAEAAATGTGVKRAECALGHDDTRQVIGVTVHPLQRDDGSIRGFLVLFADLTEARQEQQKQQLSQSLEQIGELTAGVAHEMRNSLATLKGYLTLIARDPKSDAIVDYLQEIRLESDHLQRVLEDFLAFARPGSVRLESLDLVQVCHRVAADPLLAGAAVKILATQTFEVQGDRQLLERALRNLLKNAVEAQETGAADETIELELRQGVAWVEIEIRDRGPGISPDFEKRLFQPFASGRKDGVGIGLALARRIVLLHGGEIGLENRPGGGARVWLRWPLDVKIVTKGNDSL